MAADDKERPETLEERLQRLRDTPIRRGDRRLLERAKALFELQDELCVVNNAMQRLKALEDQEADELSVALEQITTKMTALLIEAQDLLMKHYRK